MKRFQFTALLAFLFPFIASASTPALQEVLPEHTHPEFHAREEPEVNLIYSVNREPETPFDTSRSVEVITSSDIWRKGARTLPEVLMEETGIFVQQTNYGGGSPIIRGLIGKHILILIDGVRLNNATYRFGPIQYLNTIDLDSVDRIEVVRGAGTVLGSDAFGGTINVITKKGPTFHDAGPVQVSANTRFSTADDAFTSHVEMAGRTEKFRYYVGGSYQDSSDLVGGDGIGTQAGTGYDVRSGNASVDYFVDDDRTISMSYMVLQQNDVPRTDRLSSGSGRNLVFDFDPQRNQMAVLKLQDLEDRGWESFLGATFYWNRQDESRVEIRASDPDVEQFLDDSQSTFGMNLEMSSFAELLGHHHVVSGFDFSQDWIDSSRVDVDHDADTSTKVRGNLTDDSKYQIIAAYLQDRFEPSEYLTLMGGARFTRFEAKGSESSSVGTLELDSSDTQVTGSTGVIVHLGKLIDSEIGLNLIGQFTEGFRAPNLEDISRFDDRGDAVEVPSQDLKPEKIRSLEGGIKLATEQAELSVFYFHTRLDDQIERGSGTFDGLGYIDLNDNDTRDPGEPDVLQRQNSGYSTIQGVELSASHELPGDFKVFGNYTYTRGTDNHNDVPASRIPPHFGTVGVRWSPDAPRRPWAEVIYHWARAQRRLSPADEADSRIGPDGTDGFNVVHVRGGVWLTENIRATLAIENVLDEDYKYHGSGVYQPGRQLVGQAQLRF